MKSNRSRREFLQTALASASILALAEGILAETRTEGGQGIPTRPLGDTGERVSILCLGGGHIGSIKEEKLAIRIMHAAIDEGVRFFDNAWDYHGGRSEYRMGKAVCRNSRRLGSKPVEATDSRPPVSR